MLTFTLNNNSKETLDEFIPVYTGMVSKYGVEVTSDIIIDSIETRSYGGNSTYNQSYDNSDSNRKFDLIGVTKEGKDRIDLNAAPVDYFALLEDELEMESIKDEIVSDAVYEEYMVLRGKNHLKIMLFDPDENVRASVIKEVLAFLGYNLDELNPDLLLNMLNDLRKMYYPKMVY